jgi:protein TonB
MYADRFTDTRRLNPGGLAIALAINGALVVGLLFANPDIVTRGPANVLDAFNVPDDPPPPLPEPAARPRAEHQSRTVQTPVERPDPTVKGADSALVFDTKPSLGDTTGSGGSGGVTIDPPKPPIAPPVLTGAEPDPRFARDFQPAYPPAMRRAGEEGRVTVRVLVGIDGRVKDIILVSTPNDDFFQATRRQALAKWRFKPATRDGIPVEVWRVMNLRFLLDDN